MRNNFLRLALSIGYVSLFIFFVALGSATPLTAEAAEVSTSSVSSTTPKVRILIVPGHQPDLGGTVFGGVQERDVVVDIADSLAARLSQDPRYDVMIARTRVAWNPILETYFDTHTVDITAFRQSQALLMANNLASGSLKLETNQVYHNTTSPQGALQLYGINKWANENAIDVTLHIHINDDANHRAKVAGIYSGFAVYVPDHQYANATTSKAIGESIAIRLNAYHATSTLPIEDAGIVEDQNLIATGVNNSVNNAALLIEYGYIYEPQFQIASVRPIAVADYAYQTYLGLQDFFHNSTSTMLRSIAFPYNWANVVAKKNMRGPGVYALQSALHFLGYYPSAGKSFSDCPVSGLAGACTRSAIIAYQRAHKLTQTGVLGPKTRAALKKDLASH